MSPPQKKTKKQNKTKQHQIGDVILAATPGGALECQDGVQKFL